MAQVCASGFENHPVAACIDTGHSHRTCHGRGPVHLAWHMAPGA